MPRADGARRCVHRLRGPGLCEHDAPGTSMAQRRGAGGDERARTRTLPPARSPRSTPASPREGLVLGRHPAAGAPVPIGLASAANRRCLPSTRSDAPARTARRKRTTSSVGGREVLARCGRRSTRLSWIVASCSGDAAHAAVGGRTLVVAIEFVVVGAVAAARSEIHLADHAVARASLSRSTSRSGRTGFHA